MRTTTVERIIAGLGRPVDLLLMDIQGLEARVLRSAASVLASGGVGAVIVGTHGEGIHQECLEVLHACGFCIKREQAAPTIQPDGIILATASSRTNGV